MLAVLSFHAGDKEQAVALANWIRDLGGVSQHHILLCVSQSTDSIGVAEPLREAFKSVTEFTPHDDATGWPQAPNLMWKRCLEYIAESTEPIPWLWIEPDSVPLRSTWLDEIEGAYEECGKPFLLGYVKPPKSAAHSSGVGVYPALVRQYTDRLWQLLAEAWDTFFNEEFAPVTAHTDLVQDVFWQVHGSDPQAPTFPTEGCLSFLKPEAAIFHRCKDFSLIERLRERRSGSFSLRNLTNHLFSEVKKETIFTYYEPVVGIDTKDAGKLIDLWQQEWRKHGWNPVVLNEDDARKHPLYEPASKKFDEYPSINPKGYDRNCFVRWIAFDAVGAEWFADYDLMPVNPEFPPLGGDLDFFSSNALDPLIPCLVHCSEAGLKRAIHHFLDATPDKKHWSDMIALRTFTEGARRDGVKEYGEEGWQKAKCIHFSNSRMQPAKMMPRWKFIPDLLKQCAKPIAPNGEIPITQQMRAHCIALRELVNGNSSRRVMAHSELRKAGLMTAAKRRK